LIATIDYLERTVANHLRHAMFVGSPRIRGFEPRRGASETDRVLERFGNPEDPNSGSPQVQALKEQFHRYPFSVGEPEDIARIALFLASHEARMTGAIISADGGLSAY
jgi:NAD(P)-dependent dehydrogenase (short-subunit alcohol dehydrogenase family)